MNTEGSLRAGRDPGPYCTDLERLASDTRNEARREYARAATEAYAAELVAQQGLPKEGEPYLFLEQSKELARLMVRTGSWTPSPLPRRR